MNTIEIAAPAHWASYLINGDASGLTLQELFEVRKWESEHGSPCSVTDNETYTGTFSGELCELLDYIILVNN